MPSRQAQHAEGAAPATDGDLDPRILGRTTDLTADVGGQRDPLHRAAGAVRAPSALTGTAARAR
jgi:hypothetical protein